MAAPQPQAVCAFRDSIKNFKATAGLTQAELQDFSHTTLDDLRQCIATIQNDQRASRKLRYLKRLGPFLDTMERYGKIIEVFLNVSDVIAFVWVSISTSSERSQLPTTAGSCEVSAYGDERVR